MRSKYNRKLDIKMRFKKAKRKNLVYSKPGIHDCVMILDGLKPDFNIGKIIRSADAFGTREIHIIGVDMFDPDPAKGSFKWVVCKQHHDFKSCYQELLKAGYCFYCLEPGSETVLGAVEFELKTAFIVGHEEFGVSFELEDYPDIKRMAIPQWGYVQSLNVSVAASIAMFEYTRQHGKSLDVVEKHLPSGKTQEVNGE